MAQGPNNLELIDLVAERGMAQTKSHLNPTAIAISDDPLQVVVGYYDGSVICWEPKENKIYSSQPYSSQNVSGIAIAKDGSFAIVMSNYSVLVRLSLPNMNTVESIGRDDGAFDLSLSPDGRVAVTGGHNQRLLVWDLDRGNAHELPMQDARVEFISVVEGNRAITVLEDDNIQVWDLNNQSILRSQRIGSRIY